MFRNRRTSQKPSDELYKDFKASFPNLNAAAAAAAAVASSAAEAQAASLSDALDDVGAHNSRIEASASQDLKDGESTPRAGHEPWVFTSSVLTPSIMDPNHPGFSMFTHPTMQGLFTPTPGGSNTLYHHQAGDLHTPGPGMGLGTPLSLPTSEGAIHAGHPAHTYNAFHNPMSQHMQQQQPHHQPYQSVNPYAMHHQPTSFAPHQFSHQPSFDQLDGAVADSPIDDLGMDVNLHAQQHSPQMLFHSQSLHSVMKPQNIHPTGDKFRYHVTLNAATAMIKHADEIPITYLNKGQAYTLSVVDTVTKQHPAPLQYRTYVRVSFEDDQQRAKPAACWQLWREGRGTNEAHQRGGRLQAVEYVESGATGGADDHGKPRIELESFSFDSFCVRWTPSSAATVECPISLRFNFLSTDFSHSKGVKGIPVRLCAKTEAIGELPTAPSAGPEVCYCKVKLFRDHGAERKLSNDIAHVRKTIEKLQGQIAQIESGVKDGGKRKRSGSMAKLTGLDHRPGKVAKHRRTWSMSSVTSNSGRGSAEEELHIKLMTLQDMFTSTRPASVLYLRGAEQDDPDLHPVKLSGEDPPLLRNESTDSTAWDEGRQSSQPGAESSLTSRSPSANSQSGSRRESKIQQPTPIKGVSRVNSSDWHAQPQTATMDIAPPLLAHSHHLASPPDQHHQQQQQHPIKIQALSPTTLTADPPRWIDALDVDTSYQPPPDPPVKPIACFYIQPRVVDRPPPSDAAASFYRAIYLYRRTLKDFTVAAAMKSHIEPTTVLRCVRYTSDGLRVLLDDDCVRQIPEGQDMVAEFHEALADPDVDGDGDDADAVKPPGSLSRASRDREWNAGSSDVQCDGELVSVQEVRESGYELRLYF